MGFSPVLSIGILNAGLRWYIKIPDPSLKKLMDASIQFPALDFVLKFAPEISNFISEQRIVSYLRHHLQITKT